MSSELPPDDGSVFVVNEEWWKRDVRDKGALYVRIDKAIGGGADGRVRVTYHPYVPAAPASYERTFASLERARVLLGLRGFARVDRL